MSLVSYLKELGGSEPIINKSEELEALAGNICPDTLEDFFVSEYSSKDGTHIINSLWFFSKKYCLESKKLMSDEYNLDLACIFGNIDRVEIIYNNYNPLNPDETTAESKLVIHCRAGLMALNLVATQSNCTKLWSILMKYLKPNIVELIEDKG